MDIRTKGVGRVAAAVVAIWGFGACDGGEEPGARSTAAMALTGGSFSNGMSNEGFLVGGDAVDGDEGGGSARGRGGDAGGSGWRVTSDGGALSNGPGPDAREEDGPASADSGWLTGGSGSDSIADAGGGAGSDVGPDVNDGPAEDAAGAGSGEVGGDAAGGGSGDVGSDAGGGGASEGAGGQVGDDEEDDEEDDEDDDDDDDHGGKGDDDHGGKGDDGKSGGDGGGSKGNIKKSPCQKDGSGGSSDKWGKWSKTPQVFVLSAVCPPCKDPKTGSCWANHGKYVSCVTQATNEAKAKGLITGSQKSSLVSAAGKSDIGKKSWCQSKACGK
jgi:hypothetical protein